MLKFSLNLVENDTQIKKMILQALADDVNIVIKKAMPEINSRIQQVVKNAIELEPEYASLKSGQLRAELGISDPSNIDKVVDAIVNNSKITHSPVRAGQVGLIGGFEYNLIKADDMGGVIYTDIGSVFDPKGYYLPWLQWLLYEGGRPLVKKFRVQMGPSKNSRSGMAIMVRDKANWHIPPQFAGTITNNWITRAIDRLDNEIISIIQTSIEKKI
jgi:hypothetical protein